MVHTADESVRATIYHEVKTRGINAISRELSVPQGTITSYLAKVGRPGSAALIEQRFQARGREIAGQETQVEAYCGARRGRNLAITHR
jgi:transposase